MAALGSRSGGSWPGSCFADVTVSVPWSTGSLIVIGGDIIFAARRVIDVTAVHHPDGPGGRVQAKTIRLGQAVVAGDLARIVSGGSRS
jgi:hypothetical protein